MSGEGAAPQGGIRALVHVHNSMCHALSDLGSPEQCAAVLPAAVPVVTVQATVEGQPADGGQQESPEAARTSALPEAGATATAAIP